MNYQQEKNIEALKKMQKQFTKSFNTYTINWIKKVKNAIEKNETIHNICENENGSFFMEFTDFHYGIFKENDFKKLNKNLQNFCEICGKIESLTDSLPITEKEPTKESKKTLNNLLTNLLINIPSKNEFNNWINESINNFK